MNKKNFFEGSIYSAPEMEVISVVAEQGFSFSSGEEGSGIPGVGEDDFDINQ